jgi:hypothetical protein
MQKDVHTWRTLCEEYKAAVATQKKAVAVLCERLATPTRPTELDWESESDARERLTRARKTLVTLLAVTFDNAVTFAKGLVNDQCAAESIHHDRHPQGASLAEGSRGGGPNRQNGGLYR